MNNHIIISLAFHTKSQGLIRHSHRMHVLLGHNVLFPLTVLILILILFLKKKNQTSFPIFADLLRACAAHIANDGKE